MEQVFQTLINKNLKNAERLNKHAYRTSACFFKKNLPYQGVIFIHNQRPYDYGLIENHYHALKN